MLILRQVCLLSKDEAGLRAAQCRVTRLEAGAGAPSLLEQALSQVAGITAATAAAHGTGRPRAPAAQPLALDAVATPPQTTQPLHLVLHRQRAASSMPLDAGDNAAQTAIPNDALEHLEDAMSMSMSGSDDEGLQQAALRSQRQRSAASAASDESAPGDRAGGQAAATPSHAAGRRLHSQPHRPSRRRRSCGGCMTTSLAAEARVSAGGSSG